MSRSCAKHSLEYFAVHFVSMGRIGDFFRAVTQRIGSIDVNKALTRIGQVASIAHKTGSLINLATGNGLKQGAEALLGKTATGAIGGAVGYAARIHDGALAARVAIGPTVANSIGGQTNGSSMYGQRILKSQ